MLFLFLAQGLNILAQEEGKRDSLLRALEELDEGAREEQVDILLELGRGLYRRNPDSAMTYVDRAQKLAAAEGYKKGVTESANLKGVIHYIQGEYPQALPFWERVLDMKKERGTPNEVANIRNNLGLLYQEVGAYAKALEQHQKAYWIRDSLDKKKLVAKSFNNLGIAHYQRSNLDRAAFYYRKALRLKKEVGQGDLHRTQNNLAIVLKERGKTAKALELHRKAEKKARANEDLYHRAQYLTNIGNDFRKMEKWDSAQAYYRKAMELFEKLGSKDGQLSVAIAQAKLFFQEGRLQEAFKAAKETYERADKDSLVASLSEKIELTGSLAEIKAAMGDHKKAYKYEQEKEQLKDSLNTQEKEQRIQALEAHFHTRQQVNELEQQQKEAERAKRRTMWLASGGGLLLLLISAFLFIAYRQKKKANQLLQDQNQQISKQKEERDLLLQELHHRVKNNLQLILSLLNLQTPRIKDPEALEIHRDSKNRVRSMGLLHAKMYNLRELDRNQFERFVQELGQHLLETYGMEGRIELELDVEAEGLGSHTLTPLALILNELLANSLKYGFKGREEGWVRVRIHPEEGSYYLLEVRDNGTGFEEPAPKENAMEQDGLEIVESLTEQLEGELQWKNVEEGACVEVRFKNLD